MLPPPLERCSAPCTRGLRRRRRRRHAACFFSTGVVFALESAIARAARSIKQFVSVLNKERRCREVAADPLRAAAAALAVAATACGIAVAVARCQMCSSRCILQAWGGASLCSIMPSNTTRRGARPHHMPPPPTPLLPPAAVARRTCDAMRCSATSYDQKESVDRYNRAAAAFSERCGS